jgi:acetoacetyl-CoA reductase
MQMARVALVTGGTRGIGAAVSQALQAAGYAVAANYAGNTKAAETFSTRTGIHVHRWDIGDFDACASGVKAVEASLGPIDILVNNAGIVRDAGLHKMSREQWDAVVRTNLNGLFNMCRQVIGGMRARKFGRIITVSSINGQKGQFGQTNYSAAKAGELGFTKALALETARLGITANSICPGYIHTEMLDAVPPEIMEKSILPQIPVGRLGKPEEIARAVVFLAAEEAGFITGSTLSINGGQYMS